MMRPVIVLLFVATGIALATSTASAQGTGNNGGQGNNGNNNNGGGILIDAEGVLQPMQVRPTLKPRRLPGAANLEPGHVAVSLRRMSEVLAQSTAETLPSDACVLGGLTRIDQIVVDQEARDVLLIGPGEKYAASPQPYFGEASGRPLMRTGDFLTMLEAARGRGLSIRCSIDPDPSRLKQYNDHIQATAASVSFNNAAAWYQGLARLLGRQIVTVEGVPGDSRISSVLAAADYSMKRIALGLEPSGVKEIRAQLAYAGADKGATMKRWWFAPLYEDVAVTPDRTLFQLAGPRVKLMAQEELILADGRRVDSDRNRPSTEAFARQFTEHFEQLTEVRPIFADLKNQFDLAIAVSLLVREKLLERFEIELRAPAPLFEKLSPKCQTPRYVESGANIRRVNRGIIVGVVGGVLISSAAVIGNEVPRTALATPVPRAPADLQKSHFSWQLQTPPCIPTPPPR